MRESDGAAEALRLDFGMYSSIPDYMKTSSADPDGSIVQTVWLSVIIMPPWSRYRSPWSRYTSLYKAKILGVPDERTR